MMGSNGLSFPRGQRGHHDHYNYPFPYIYGPPFLRPSLGRFGGGIGEWFEEVDDFQPDCDHAPTRGTGGRRRGPEISRSRYPSDHHDYPHQSRMAAQAIIALPFGKAMIKLHKVIGRAEDFYNQFLSNYDSDIAAIKPYAKSNVLNKLWIMKVSGKADDGSSENGGEYLDGEGSLQKFNDWREKLSQALKDAVDCKISEGQEPRKSASRAESMERLRKKVVTAYEQIKVLLCDAKTGRESCRVLLVELGLLKNLVDPEAESNQGLVKPGDYVDDQDDCGGGQGEDQDSGGVPSW
ncbi:ribonuclease p complex subunit [Diplocarpon rosae]|nr:ribonuclease p complex subunit [Diplocarpon rosae]